MTKRALVVIDIQNDYFPGGKWSLHNMDQAASNAAQVLAHTRAAGDLVIHVRHESEDEGAPFFVTGTEGAEIHCSVTPEAGEATVVKYDINAFHQTNLQQLLDAQEVEQVTLVGAMSHMCIDAAARAASDYGYAVTVVEDACATLDLTFGDKVVAAEDVHAAYMSALGFAYADIQNTATYLNA